ncbi:MAG: hypothetical protein ACI9B7_000966 [Oleispira sp.]|jgi:hypothetical protein
MASEWSASGMRVQAGSVDVSIQIKLGILDFIRLTVLEVLFGHIH